MRPRPLAPPVTMMTLPSSPCTSRSPDRSDIDRWTAHRLGISEYKRVDSRFVDPVDPQQFVDLPVEKPPHWRGGQAEVQCSQDRVLAHVPSLQQHEAVAPIAVL